MYLKGCLFLYDHNTTGCSLVAVFNSRILLANQKKSQIQNTQLTGVVQYKKILQSLIGQCQRFTNITSNVTGEFLSKEPSCLNMNTIL